MRTPPFLHTGDRVGVVAPSARPDARLLERGCRVIRSWGLTVNSVPEAYTRTEGYLAASDAQRLEALQTALDDPSLGALFCARGGYGLTRIVDRISFSGFVRHPKWVVGFSDITALHLKLHQLGVASLHACMPVQFADPAYRSSVAALRSLLFGTPIPPLAAPPHPFNREGAAQAPLIGGNLSLLVDALATSTAMDTAGKILALEEVGEPLYKVDRMLTHLQRAGLLDRLAGLVLGYVTSTEPAKDPFDETFPEMTLHKTGGAAYPIAFGFPIGHAAPNLPFRYSSSAHLQVGEGGATLRF